LDINRFKNAYDTVVNKVEKQSGIGLLSEKTLHAVIKHYYEPDELKHEMKIDGYVVDILTDSGIIEVQTRAFNKLRKKLEILLQDYPVLLVYPLPRYKWLYWIDKTTGELTKKRKSPKLGHIYDAVPELYRIRLLLRHPNLSLCLLLVDIEEYRYLDGWSDDKKKGFTRSNRIPVNIADEVVINGANEFIKLIPDILDNTFTSADYKIAAKVNLRTAQTALNILNYVGIVRRVGKTGNSYIYERNYTE
jgi:hypothetical protein